jgi:hypothetical protein
VNSFPGGNDEVNYLQGLRGRQPVSDNERGIDINNGYAQSASSGGDIDYSVWGSTDTDCGSVGHEQLRRSTLLLGPARDYRVDAELAQTAPTSDENQNNEDQLCIDEAADGGSSVVSIRSTRD